MAALSFEVDGVACGLAPPSLESELARVKAKFDGVTRHISESRSIYRGRLLLAPSRFR